MGLFDFLMSDYQKQKKVALELGVDIGVFEQCPVCREITESRSPEYSEEKINAAISELFSRNSADQRLFDGNTEKLKTMIIDTGKKLPLDCTCDII